MLTDLLKKIKFWIIENKSDIFVALVIFFVGISSFGLGRLSVLWPKKEPITIENKVNGEYEMNNSAPAISTSSKSISMKGKYVASKFGKSYNFPWCPGTSKIKEENKIWFNTKEEAESRGYKPAGNCPGL